MENKSSALQTVTRHLVASYREFFDLAAPTAKMPSHQLDLFLDQAMHRQYQVALFFDQDRPPFIGRITRPLGEKRYLVKATIVTSIGSSPKRRYPTLNDLNDRCWPVAQCRALPSCHSSQAADHRIRIFGLA